MRKMNPEVKKLWVNALRSGKYKQEIISLKNNGRYSCFGVLCDIHSKVVGGKWVLPSTLRDLLNIKEGVLTKLDNTLIGMEEYLPSSVDSLNNFEFDAISLPEEVSKWAGIRCDYGDVEVSKKITREVFMNSRKMKRKDFDSLIRELFSPNDWQLSGRFFVLSSVNDIIECNFNEIADIIEKDL